MSMIRWAAGYEHEANYVAVGPCPHSRCTHEWGMQIGLLNELREDGRGRRLMACTVAKEAGGCGGTCRRFADANDNPDGPWLHTAPRTPQDAGSGRH